MESSTLELGFRMSRLNYDCSACGLGILTLSLALVNDSMVSMSNNQIRESTCDRAACTPAKCIVTRSLIFSNSRTQIG